MKGLWSGYSVEKLKFEGAQNAEHSNMYYQHTLHISHQK